MLTSRIESCSSSSASGISKRPSSMKTDSKRATGSSRRQNTARLSASSPRTTLRSPKSTTETESNLTRTHRCSPATLRKTFDQLRSQTIRSTVKARKERARAVRVARLLARDRARAPNGLLPTPPTLGRRLARSAASGEADGLQGEGLPRVEADEPSRGGRRCHRGSCVLHR